MRVLIDTSVFISYLLNPHQESFVQLILDAIIEDRITLLVSEPLLEEIERTVKRKKYLIEAITARELERFLLLLRAISEMIPSIDSPIPTITRDVNDDYLIAYAVVGNADYLVSVDKDLLVLGEVGTLKIVHTREFRTVL